MFTKFKYLFLNDSSVYDYIFNTLIILQRLVTLYDPTNPVLRSKLLQYIARHKTASYNLRSSQCDFTDITDITDNIVSIESY